LEKIFMTDIEDTPRSLRLSLLLFSQTNVFSLLFAVDVLSD
jgi:hypothetical protein